MPFNFLEELGDQEELVKINFDFYKIITGVRIFPIVPFDFECTIEVFLTIC
jgi:uncharacterized membrane protein YdjX (TVP38/TMEM64 family)